MAEVLSPISTPNDRVSALHIHPASSDQYSGMSGTQNNNQARNGQPQRPQYNAHSGGSGYRGTAAAPIAPYAFKSTPQLRNDQRITSAPSTPTNQPLASDNSSAANRQRYPAPASISTTSSSSSNGPPTLPAFSKDDSLLFSNFQLPDLMSTGLEGLSNENDGPRIIPDRYKRGHRRAETNVSSQSPPKGSVFEGVTASGVFGSAKLGQFQYDPKQFSTVTAAASRPDAIKTSSLVEENRPRTSTSTPDRAEPPKRYRRRNSFGNTIEAGTKTPPDSQSIAPSHKEPSSPSQTISTKQDARPSSSGSTQQPNPSSSPRIESGIRTFTSADAVRRINNPSPLSRPLSGESASGTSSPHITSPYSANPSIAQSPAVAAMAALNVNDKDGNKGVKSRLRRAFSFGSTAELKRATEGPTAIDRAKARQEQFSSELDEEQDAIARKQEASGLGNSIYTGQGGVFSGSTDNLSISSTASSASLMLRKMGKGMKKGGRSIKGLFRPKSVIGVPAADGPSEPSVGPVSMVTVEAEREQVNVNADPHDQPGGGTGFPRLERNSVDAARASISTINGNPSGGNESRAGIVGREQDRQEVLTAVKRGILKRTAAASSPTASPLSRPMDGSQDYSTTERYGSPAPSTTSSEPRRTGHRRTDSHTIEGDDYFASVPRLAGNHSSRSLPGTPRSLARNISFSPRLQFHDVWSSTEYDRRGEIATCNRLTPLLAQQIKEELNTFKMEMEVHEASKPHTHFF